MTEIYLENEKLDITSEVSSLLTFQLDDIKDFAARNTTVSKTIVLPGTTRNNALLGGIFNAQVSNPYDPDSDNISTNFNASVSASCLIFNGSIQVFKGIFRILEIVIVNKIPEYECAVFGELTSLVGALGAGKLEDIDLSVYDHTYNATNVTASWDNAPGSGYYYPMIDYGKYSLLKQDWDIRTFRPALYVKEYIDKMFEAADFTYESELFDTDRFKRLVIPNNQKLLFNKQLIALEAVNTGHSYSGTTPELIAFNAVSIAGGFTPSGGDTIFTYSGATIIGNVTFSMIVTTLLSAFAPPYEVEIKKNGVTFGIVSIILPSGPPGTVTGGPFNVTIETGDQVTVNLVPPPFGSPELTASFTVLRVNNTSSQPVEVNPGETVHVNGGIPQNILQKDFLSSIIRLFNLYVYEDRFKPRHLIITPYVDFFDVNVSGMTDWTYKLDRSKKISIKPMSELNSRFYDFNFKDDSDYYNDLYKKRYNRSYGSYQYDSQFEFANESNKLELIFSGTPLVGYNGEDKIISTIFKLSNDTEDNTDSNIRILQTLKVTGVTAWSILDDVSTLLAGITSYGYAGHYNDPDAPANDIQFGVPAELFFVLVTGDVSTTQFNVYWSPYMAEITDKDSKLLTAMFKLTNKDIFDLDFSKFIYVDGSIWRLNKIVDWNALSPDVAQVELLKTINTIY